MQEDVPPHPPRRLRSLPRPPRGGLRLCARKGAIRDCYAAVYRAVLGGDMVRYQLHTVWSADGQELLQGQVLQGLQEIEIKIREKGDLCAVIKEACVLFLLFHTIYIP